MRALSLLPCLVHLSQSPRKSTEVNTPASGGPRPLEAPRLREGALLLLGKDKNDGSFSSVSIRIWNVATLVTVVGWDFQWYLGLPENFLCLIQEAIDREVKLNYCTGLTN